MPTTISPDIAALLDQPLFGSLGTIRPDNSVQVNPMWYERDGDTIRFTHTVNRAKYRNLQHNPAMSMMVNYPGDPYRYIELRGTLTETVPDPTGAFYVQLAKRYGQSDPAAPDDSASRVILVMGVDKAIPQGRPKTCKLRL